MGVAAGFDAAVGDMSHVGISYSYSTTVLDGDGEGASRVGTDSYRVSLYGDFTSPFYYVEGSLGIALNKNDNRRTLDFGGLNRTASATYDATEYSINARAGIPLRISNEAFITPTAGLSWTHVEGATYTETGAGSLNLTVAQEDVDVATGFFGVRLHSVMNLGIGKWVMPDLRASIQYDFVGDEAQATSAFAGGGAGFTTEGTSVERLGVSVGAGVTLELDNLNFSVLYGAGFKSGDISHTGAVRGEIRF